MAMRGPTSEKSHSLDGTKTIGQLNREAQAIYDAQPATARCAWCPWTFEGTAAEARDASALHRATAHAEKVNGKTARELLDAMDAGEPVAAKPGPAIDTSLSSGAALEGQNLQGGGASKPKWSREEIIAAIQGWAAEHGSPPTVSAWVKKVEGYPTCSTVSKYFGSWAAAIEAAGFPRPTRGGQPGGTPIVAKPERRARKTRAARPKVPAQVDPPPASRLAKSLELTVPLPPLEVLEDLERSRPFIAECEKAALRYDVAAGALRQIADGIRTLEELAT